MTMRQRWIMSLVANEFYCVDAVPERLADAAAEDAKVISVLEVFGEHDVAHVKECCKLRQGEVPDAPWVLKLVGGTGVENDASGGSCVGRVRRCLATSRW